MSVSLPNGSIIAIASGYAASLAVSAATNALPCVLTTATSTYAAGDFLEVTSGWSRLNQKIARLSSAAATSAALEGIDTTLTSIYPATSGIGSVRKISGWTQLSQILKSSTSGGEQQFTTYQFLESDAEKRIPTVKSASGMSFSIADDSTLAGYIVAAAANDDRLPRAVRITLPSGGILLYNAYVSLNKTPSLVNNEIMAVEVTLSLLAEPVRY